MEQAKRAVFASIHPCIAISVLSNIVLHELQLTEHLLSALLPQYSISGHGRLFHVSKRRGLDLIFLIMHHVRQVLSLARLLPIEFSPLVD